MLKYHSRLYFSFKSLAGVGLPRCCCGPAVRATPNTARSILSSGILAKKKKKEKNAGKRLEKKLFFYQLACVCARECCCWCITITPSWRHAHAKVKILSGTSCSSENSTFLFFCWFEFWWHAADVRYGSYHLGFPLWKISIESSGSFRSYFTRENCVDTRAQRATSNKSMFYSLIYLYACVALDPAMR